MKRFTGALRRFFLPPADARTFTRLVPLFAVALIVVVVFGLSTFAWEESNSPVFCGTACHTMPPEYVTYQHSAHTNVTCEDCHMGRDRLPVMVQRKVKYSWQTGTAMLFNTYEYPIFAKNMAPAREACENCHKPEKFSTDTLVELKHFASDETNSPTSTYLVVKTGGGTSRQGLGFGIHWHIENPVQFYAADGVKEQDIPYVVVTKPDGTKVEYVDVESELDPTSIQPGQLKTMDCITCHNRTAHMFEDPDAIVNDLLSRGLISIELKNIKQRGVALLSVKYNNEKEAASYISVLKDEYPDQPELADQAIQALEEAWKNNNFPDQKAYWDTHPNNLAHKNNPGCLRCHDGKHLSPAGEAVRLECNLCHSIPVVSKPNQLTANLELGKGFEPPSHQNPNWISLHNEVFDETCAGCHTVEDAGGTSNTSFCSNSACHGATWEFAGFDAPKLRAILQEQAKALAPTPAPTSEPSAGESTGAGAAEGSLTYDGEIGTMLKDTCGACHGSAAMAGLNVTTFDSLMAGGKDGPVIVSGDPEASKIVQVQKSGGHPGQLSDTEIETLVKWIQAGAPQN